MTIQRFVEESAVTQWSAEFDVIVVGAGCAGVCAAIEAATLNVDVLVLDCASGIGGTSAASGGVVYLGGGTRVQTACGFDDDAGEMMKYLMHSCGESPNAEKIRRYCENSVGHFEWLVAQGVPFKESFWPHYYEPTTDDTLYYSGCEHTHPFRSIARPAPRGHAVSEEGSCTAGAVLMKKLEVSARRSGVQFQLDTRLMSLVATPEQKVIGVQVRCGKEHAFLRAKSGVVIATGGFINNRDMLARYAPRLLDSVPITGSADDGSGINAARSVGADFINAHGAAYGCPILQPPQLIKGIVFNRYGQRFINEDVNHKCLGTHIILEQAETAYLLVDSDIFCKPTYLDQPPIAVGETIAEVESELGLPEGALQDTVNFYNCYARERRDPLFGKLSEHIKPLNNPPFGVFDCRRGAGASYPALTLGGLNTKPQGNVLDIRGQVIPGLYAAGRAAAGISAQVCFSSGLQIGDGTYFGRLAGMSAARGE